MNDVSHHEATVRFLYGYTYVVRKNISHDMKGFYYHNCLINVEEGDVRWKPHRISMGNETELFKLVLVAVLVSGVLVAPIKNWD